VSLPYLIETNMTILQGEYLVLRPLPAEHLPALLKVYQGTPLYFDGLGYDVQRLAPADVLAQWDAAQATPGRALLGVYHIVTDLLIGVIDIQVGMPQPDAAAILLLLIWGGFQRQGYGQDCMALIEAWLAAEVAAPALWVVAAENEEGLSFLRLQGFEPTGAPASPPIAAGPAFWMRR
jgi:ribosomal protein S18 acetylase RimI-like enzyme